MHENSATLQSIPVPPGVDADIWEGDPPRRVIFEIVECVLNSTGDPLRSPLVTAQAIQRADGTIESREVSVESLGDPGLTPEQARELAAAILAAAVRVESWAGQ